MQSVEDTTAWEIIVVDNNSTDNTAEITMAIWKNFKNDIPFKVVKEARQGLTYARQAGANEAAFDFLIYCDDDNWLHPDYVQRVFSLMSANDNIAVLGGRSNAVFESQMPTWFERYQAAYAVGKPLSSSGFANARTFLAGAGMAIRKSVLRELDDLCYRQVLSDRKGMQLSSGGDAELCLAVIFLGYDLYYDNSLEFLHYIPANRLSWRYCINMMSKGQAIPRLYFDLYRYCHMRLETEEEISFRHAYKILRRKTFSELLNRFTTAKPIWFPFKVMIRSQPGSRREVELKASFNQMLYLLRNRRRIRQDFAVILTFLKKLKDSRSQEPCDIRIKTFQGI